MQVSAETNGEAAGVVGLLDVEAFEDTKEEFGFGNYGRMTEEILDAELREFMRAQAIMDNGTSELDAEDEGPRFQHRTEDGANQDGADADGTFMATNASEIAEALANLRPSHRWLALRHKLFRPTMAPQRPTTAELQVAHEIRKHLESEGVEVGGAQFKARFNDEWIQVCRDARYPHRVASVRAMR